MRTRPMQGPELFDFSAWHGPFHGWGAIFPRPATIESRPYSGPNPIHGVPPGPRTSITLALALILTLGIVDTGNGEPWEW